LTIAELGDKTQVMTMAFAARHKITIVLVAIMSATAFLNLFAVVLGKFITLYLPTSVIKTGAGLMFLAFGIWTLLSQDGLEAYANKKGRPFWSIFGAFFIAELGDKTQLAVVALAARYNQPAQIWLGATLGMGLANLLGILVGNRLGAALPEKAMRWIAGLLFMAFGLLMLSDSLKLLSL
jgi:putative Ca2+/H+ antiporter (TMEM165/GDT1 family)